MDRFTYLTRSDDVGCEPYDSIAWALETHVKQPDGGTFKAAVLIGTEDAPECIHFYDHAEVTVDSVPRLTWYADA